MFTNLLPNSDRLFSVIFTDYSKRHYLNKFQKKYKGNIWDFTEMSIKEDLSRLRSINNKLQKTDQIDELKHKNNKWLAKYDFRAVDKKVSPKLAGNRCTLYIDNDLEQIQILLIYSKNDLPKNKKETKFIIDEIKANYKDIVKEMGY